MTGVAASSDNLCRQIVIIDTGGDTTVGPEPPDQDPTRGNSTDNTTMRRSIYGGMEVGAHPPRSISKCDVMLVKQKQYIYSYSNAIGLIHYVNLLVIWASKFQWCTCSVKNNFSFF